MAEDKVQEQKPLTLDEAEKAVEAKTVDLDKAKIDYDKAKQAYEKQVFDKYGYEIVSPLKYEGETLTPGMRDKLGKLSKDNVKALLEAGVIRR